MSTETSVDIDLEALYEMAVPCQAPECEADATHFVRLTARVCGHKLEATLCEPHLLRGVRYFTMYPVWQCYCGVAAAAGWIVYWRL